MFFPVRSTFFYDRPFGPLVNAAMSGMRMFPPLLRDRGDAKMAFNRWAIDRCIEELAIDGTVMGLHPEGTRNQTNDPYAFLSAKPGVGRVALGSPALSVRPVQYVIPTFIVGPSNDFLGEFVKNWRRPERHRIDLHFGRPIDLSDLRANDRGSATALRASERCLDAIRELSEDHKRARNEPSRAADPRTEIAL